MFWNKADSFPDGYIIHREIKKAITGKDFFYNDPQTGKPIRCEGLNYQELMYYVTFWDDFHYLNVLPHGAGTLKERRWLIDTIKMFERCYIGVQNFLEEQAMRKIRGAHG